MEAHVADVLETLDSLGIERADWVGYSFGGLVAAAGAAAHPARVRRLALLEPGLSLPPAMCLQYAHEELEDRSFATEEEAIADMLSAGTIFHAPREMLEEEARTNTVRGADGRLRYRYSRPGAIGAWSELAGPPPPVAGAPTLIVLGERSWVEVDTARHPDARVLTVPGGHSVLWDAFEETASALEGFL